MNSRVSLAVLFLALVLASQCRSQQIPINGSFESGTSGWTTGSYPVSLQTSYMGVARTDGSRFLALAGPVNVGYTYARVITQSKSAPFGTGVPADNFVLYLTASLYLHTNDGRDVSYALTLEPGYGQAGASFHGGPQNAWVTAQTWGYYLAHDPFDAASAVKPIVVSLDLRDPLQSGEYLLLGNVQLVSGGAGVPEPSSLAGFCVGIALLVTRARRGREQGIGNREQKGSGVQRVSHTLSPFRAFLLSCFRDCICSLLLLAICASLALAGVTRHDVLVIANSNSPASVAVADYYRIKRKIPASHVRTIACSTSERVSPAEFVSIRDQIKAHLVSLGSVAGSPGTDPISTIVLCTGVPHIASDSGECYSAVDSALSACFTECTWGKEPLGVYGEFQPAPGFPNPYYGDYVPAMPFEQFRADSALSTSWEAFPSPGFTLVRMLDPNTALAAGGAGLLYRGVRTGGTWAWSPVRGKDKAFIGWEVSCISVLDSAHAYACTGNPSKPHGGGTIIATSNGGLTWTRLRYSTRGTGWKLLDAFLGVDFADTSHGWAVGTTGAAYGTAKALAIATSNGGSSWMDLSAKLPASFFPRAISAADASNVWICGANGGIYRSTDGGNTWSLANTGAPAVDYTSIWIKPSGGAFKGWVAGEGGKILRTENGTSWTTVASGLTTSNITDLAAYSQTRACAAYGATSFLSYTSTGGWVLEPVGLAPVVSAAATTASDGVAVGATRYIFADSGANWVSAHSGTDTPWRLRYMVTRLDGYSEDRNGDGLPDDVKAIIDRACAPASSGEFVLDEATKLDSGTITATQFKPARDALLPIVGSSNITWDQTSTFLTHQTGVMGYLSWGMHDYYASASTVFGRPLNSWVNGGIGEVIESTDGRGFHLPYYAWAMYRGGTAYANKLSVDGGTTYAPYTGFRVALLNAAGTELASGSLVGGTVQISLTSVNWPADHSAYAQLYFPSTDPLHPGEPIEHARYPWSGATTEFYDNRAAGLPLVISAARNLLSEMLREGASGGLANVDEPWSSYVGDAAYLFPRYAQGYTFAESAYMCLPGLGWQEVAVGDPLMAPYATPPTVSITAPSSDGQTVSGAVRISASATANGSTGIAKVEFWLDDDTLLATDTTSPYYHDLNTVLLSDGPHSVEAVAYENDAVANTAGAFRTIIVNNHIVAKVSDLAVLANGTIVGLQGKRVSAAFAGVFYVTDPDRTRGIRVRSAVTVHEGDTVTVTGKLQTTSGEREIAATGVFVTTL